VTEAALGGRAIQRAVTRVKFEQASKESMQTPTRLLLGEGRADKEAIDTRTCPVCRDGDAGNRGRPTWIGGRGFNIAAERWIGRVSDRVV
jgi:hypothetical protein